MEALMDDQNVSVVVSQCSGERGTISSGNGVVRTSSTVSGVVRANGPIFTTPTLEKQVVTSSSTQAIAVPQPGGTVSIVHLSIPSHMHGQSVIQQGSNQQSVIQAPATSTVQSLPKNVILLNKNVGSVIHSTEGEAVHSLQLISATKGENEGNIVALSLASLDDESKKRRELLARRPSYRKILNELSATDSHSAVGVLTSAGHEIKEETMVINGEGKMNDQSSENEAGTITVGATQYHTAGLLKVVPASAIQLASQDGLQGIQTLTVSNPGSAGAGSIVQYAQGQDGHIFVPVTVSTDLHTYQIRSAGSSPSSSMAQGVVMTNSGSLSPQQIVEEASRNRELRLLKNREAAKECRRKKKEYIKCLENRVAVLENQNKALIDELKSLKELYCRKND